MRSLFFVVILLLCSSTKNFAQQAQKISENEPIQVDGIEYGYYIKNETVKEAGGKEMSRFEVTLYATNKGTCLKLFLFEQKSSYSSIATALDDLAKFDCKNATGQRLTSKSGGVKAKPFYTIAKVEVKDCGTGKSKFEDKRVQIGYALKPQETVTNTLIFIVPLNEKPNIQVSPIFNASTF